jgi:hypothetical protein
MLPIVLPLGHVYCKEQFTQVNTQKQAHQAPLAGDAAKGERT